MEENQTKVSVIVPVYNVEKYIHRCINSLLEQTLKDIEIILVDDESPDDSGKICDEYAKRHSNIKVIHKANGGLGYARNSGLEVAIGEFVGFIDSDDFIEPNMYEDLYCFAKNNHLDTVFSAGFKFYDKGNIEEKPEVINIKIWENNKIYEDFIPNIIGSPPTYCSDVKYVMSVCRGIYSLKQIQKSNIKFVSEREFLSEDILFNIEYLIKSRKIGMIPKCYYYYCCNDGSLTRSYRPDMKDRMNRLYVAIKEKLQEVMIYDFANLNLDRLYLLMVRGAIKSEFLNNTDIKNRKLKLKKLFNDEILTKILKTYPFELLPIKHRIFFHLLKYKVSFVFRIFANVLAK